MVEEPIEIMEEKPSDVAPGIKRGRGRPKGSSNKPRLATQTDIQAGITDLMGIIGTGVFMLNHYDGSVILANATNCASALTKAASQNPAIHKVLSSLIQTSAWAAVGSAFLPIGMAIAANHGVAPEIFLIDTGTPATLNFKKKEASTTADSGVEDMNAYAVRV